jgi:CheY-like chemotaxis protein
MNRTLGGHLEDLDLDEVARVIALSGRSGVLTLDSSEGSAELTFSMGRVVGCRRSDSPDTVGDLLVRAGVLTDAEAAAAAEADETLEGLLRRLAGEHGGEEGLFARAEAVLLENLKVLAGELLLTRSGSFFFRVIDREAAPQRYLRDTGLRVTAGLDAEELARDAKQRRGKRQSALGRPAGRAQDEETPVDLVLVDDDADFCARFHRQAHAAGLGVRLVPRASSALELLGELGAGRRLMVVDLVMPRADGRGILGGLEVLRAARAEGRADCVFLALDGPHEDAVGIARGLGVAGVLDKPSTTDCSLPSFAAFLNPVLERLGRPRLVDEPIDLVGQLRVELGDVVNEWDKSSALMSADVLPDLSVLKSLLQELNDPSFEDEIPLLVLRFAAAFFSRAAVFRAHEGQGVLAGVGAFGLGGSDVGRTIHAIRLPLDADTVFTRSIRERQGVRQPSYESEWNSRLWSSLGGPRPKEVYTAPLFSRRGLEAVLYADNAIDGNPFPDLSLFEIFLLQSGIALERWSLLKRIDELSAPAA